MSDLEDRLVRLKPLPAPDSLWEKVREGRPAAPRRSSRLRDGILFAAAAALLLGVLVTLLAFPMETPAPAQEGDTGALLERLKALPHKVVCESNRDGNWDLYLQDAAGSTPINLTKTPDIDELYPKVSPDGTRICFVADEGRDDAKARNIYVMKLDGTERVKIADNGREPCWKADGSAVAYLKGELDTFTYSDFATKGIFIHDLKSGATRQHPNSKILHLYTLNWSPDGKWFVATVHGGMGFKHGILALEAEGEGVYDLKLGGCRPDLSPDGRRIAWGNGDHAIGVADLDLSVTPPKVSNVRNAVECKDPMETYHVDWSPDGKYLAFSYGPKLKKRNLKGLLPEFPGVEAPDWNLCVADAEQKNVWVALTTDGKSNKEPDWAAGRGK